MTNLYKSAIRSARSAERQARLAAERAKYAWHLAQSMCPHERVRELRWDPASGAHTPIRVCVDCGLAEIGYNYKILAPRVYNLIQISAKALYRLCNGRPRTADEIRKDWSCDE